MSEGGIAPKIADFGDVSVRLGDNLVGTLEIHRPPNNYIDVAVARSLADALEALDRDGGCRAVVLCSEGKHFCAGGDFSGGREMAAVARGASKDQHIFDEVVRLFAAKTPVIAAVQGAAVGGGLGLALVADLRIASPDSRFAANFARLGLHHGFGLTVTLPAVVGQQRALDMLYTGRRLSGDEALRVGLCDRLVSPDALRAEARAWAEEIAISAPLALRSIRQTMRGDLAGRIQAATDREKAEQERLSLTNDFKEGIAAMSDHRRPEFRGR
jgi:enoyl-CoA hydratase/carnithine racemase